MSFRPLDKSMSSSEKPSSGFASSSTYSWPPLIQTRLFRIPSYFKLPTISFGFSLHSFTNGYFELPQFRTIFRFPCEFERARLYCKFIRYDIYELNNQCKGCSPDYSLDEHSKSLKYFKTF